ncbi:MAG: hypothetical protein R2741_01385 [Methanolobus sp.]
MKLGPLNSIAKSFTYSLQNSAGGQNGLIFQFYAFLWIVLTTFFIVTRILSFSEKADPIYIASAPLYIVLLYIPIHIFWIYEQNVGIERRRVKELQLVDSVKVEYKFSEPSEMGFNNLLYLRLTNPSEKRLENIWIRSVFPASVRCDKPVICLGDLEPMSSTTTSFSFVPLVAGNHSMGYYELYFELNNHEYQKPPIFYGDINVLHSYLVLDFEVSEPLKFGHPSSVTVRMKNYANVSLNNLHVKCIFPKTISYDTAFSNTITIAPGASFDTTFTITPVTGDEIDLGGFEVMFDIERISCKVDEIEFGKYPVQIPEIKVRINIPDALYSEVGNTIGIYVDNNSDEVISNVCFNSCFTSFIECHDPNVCIRQIQPYESGYTSIVVKPVNSGKIDLGNLNYSFEVNEILFQKEPIDLGTHAVN